MKVNFILSEIEADVQDVLSTNFVYTSTQFVPNRDDSGLSYERGKDKRGKEIETCVLFVDIRNSVALTDKHQHQTMGRVYTAFTKAVLKVARHHNGHIRNIIGDRVMIVFPVANCFKNAVDCAVSINHIASKIINKRFKVDFKCGIGIAHGNLRVIKVGIQRNGTENGENKGLVWVGKPANNASRITDMANKIIEEEMVEVKLNPINPAALDSGLFAHLLGPLSLDQLEETYSKNQPCYLSKVDTKVYSKEEFVNKLSNFEKGSIDFLGGRLLEFRMVKKEVKFPAILITESVLNGLKRDHPEDSTLKNGYWKIQPKKFKEMTESVYGADLTWTI
jgi:class 3 adenylate cyclase